jgi:hypothetical protein
MYAKQARLQETQRNNTIRKVKDQAYYFYSFSVIGRNLEFKSCQIRGDWAFHWHDRQVGIKLQD